MKPSMQVLDRRVSVRLAKAIREKRDIEIT